MGEYSYILEQQGKTTSEKLAEFTAAIGWRDELATYRIAQDEYEMRAAAAAEQGISLLDEPPYTDEELAALDAESAAYYDAFTANYVATAAFSGSGSGTQSDPYIITNTDQWAEMSNDLSAYYILGNDIDFGGELSVISTPISTSSAPFSGKINGNGHIISNIYLNLDSSSGVYIYFTRGSGYNVYDLYIQNLQFDNQVGMAVLFWQGTINSCYFDDVHCSGGSPSFQTAAITVNTNVYNCIVSSSTFSMPAALYSRVAPFGQAWGVEIHNTYVYDVTIDGNPSTGACGGLCGIGGVDSGTPEQYSNCVVISSQISGGIETHRMIGGSVVSEGACNGLYASPDTTVNGATVSGGTSSNWIGADVSPSTYHTQAFWESTLGWDFDTVWYWDSTENLPKLRAFLHGPTITSVSATPTTGGTTTQITLSATVQDATSYQWQYSADSGGTWQDITGATAATATWTPGAAGTYQVRLLATNADGTTISGPVTVIIYPDPTISDVTIYPNPSDESATFLISAIVNDS